MDGTVSERSVFQCKRLLLSTVSFQGVLGSLYFVPKQYLMVRLYRNFRGLDRHPKSTGIS